MQTYLLFQVYTEFPRLVTKCPTCTYIYTHIRTHAYIYIYKLIHRIGVEKFFYRAAIPLLFPNASYTSDSGRGETGLSGTTAGAAPALKGGIAGAASLLGPEGEQSVLKLFNEHLGTCMHACKLI